MENKSRPWFLVAGLCLIAMLAYAANPTFSSFNATQFTAPTPNGPVSIKSGATITNGTDAGTFTALHFAGDGSGITGVSATSVAAPGGVTGGPLTNAFSASSFSGNWPALSLTNLYINLGGNIWDTNLENAQILGTTAGGEFESITAPAVSGANLTANTIPAASLALGSGTAGQVPTINIGATAVVWATPTGGGGGGSDLLPMSLTNSLGVSQYYVDVLGNVTNSGNIVADSNLTVGASMTGPTSISATAGINLVPNGTGWTNAGATYLSTAPNVENLAQTGYNSWNYLTNEAWLHSMVPVVTTGPGVSAGGTFGLQAGSTMAAGVIAITNGSATGSASTAAVVLILTPPTGFANANYFFDWGPLGAPSGGLGSPRFAQTQMMSSNTVSAAYIINQSGASGLVGYGVYWIAYSFRIP